MSDNQPIKMPRTVRFNCGHECDRTEINCPRCAEPARPALPSWEEMIRRQFPEGVEVDWVKIDCETWESLRATHGGGAGVPDFPKLWQEYRDAYQTKGGGHIETGRAWDRMTRACEAFRAEQGGGDGANEKGGPDEQ